MSQSFGNILPKSSLPKGWEEISRSASETSLLINLGHINPEDHADPLLTSGNPSATLNGEPVAVHSISTRGSMAKFYEVMTQAAATGFMVGYTPEKIQQMKREHNKLQDVKYDMSFTVSIARFPDSASADQALQTQITLPTQGFAGLKIPGKDGKMFDYLDHPEVKKHMSAEQAAMVKEMMAKSAAQVQTKFQETGTKYYIGKYLGLPAALTEMANPNYARFIAPKPKPPKKDPHAFHGGGFDPLAGKGILPRRPPPGPPPQTLNGCIALQVGDYLLSGSLLGAAQTSPSGNTFCEALTKYKTYIETEKVEGQIYTTKHVVPVASDLASEGYLNREEVESILSTVIKSLK